MKTKLFRSMAYGVLVAFGVGACGVGWWACARPRSGIEDFDLVRDAKDLEETLGQDLYWLNAVGYDVQHMMTTHSPSKESRYFGKLFIKVMRDNGKFAGFVTYYQKKFYEGWVQYLSVNKKFRGKGYGRQLLKYAMDHLMSMGCTQIGLITRTTNVWAQKIYDRLGFTKVNIDDGVVTYVYTKT